MPQRAFGSAHGWGAPAIVHEVAGVPHSFTRDRREGTSNSVAASNASSGTAAVATTWRTRGSIPHSISCASDSSTRPPRCSRGLAVCDIRAACARRERRFVRRSALAPRGVPHRPPVALPSRTCYAIPRSIPRTLGLSCPALPWLRHFPQADFRLAANSLGDDSLPFAP